MARLANKVAMVTGGALGIGEAVVRLFAAEGANVVVADVDSAAGNKVVGEVLSNGNEATFVGLDVTSEQNWQRAMEITISKYGKLNILVNNAGISLGKTVEDTSLDEWNHVMNVNATGVFLGTKFGISFMKDNGELCSIINRSSVDGQVGEAGLAAYCASKGAVTLLTKASALYCGERGYKIRVNSVHPGYVRTGLTEKEALDSGRSPEEYFNKVAHMHPIGYIGKPIDIAYADLYLACDESLFVTGSELVIDGGWTAQ